MKSINWKKLRKVYESNPNLSLKALADRYHVNYGTVRNHKAKFHWVHDNVTARSMVDILDKYGLTNKERLFCEYYLKSYNAYEAYKRAFCCKWSTAHTNAYRLLRNKTIQSALQKLHKKQAISMHIDRSDVLDKMVRTFMSADPGKFIKFGNHEVTSRNGRKYHRSYAYFKNNHGDTSGLQGVGLSKDGTPTIDYPDMNRLGAFLYQVLPIRQQKHAEDNPFIKAITKSVQIEEIEDKKNRQAKMKRAKLIAKGHGKHEN